jgi:hypothetical protein
MKDLLQRDANIYLKELKTTLNETCYPVFVTSIIYDYTEINKTFPFHEPRQPVEK